MTLTPYRLSQIERSFITPAASSCQEITVQPACVNLTIYEGDDFFLDLEIVDAAEGEPVDLTGGQAKAQIRVTPDADNVYADFDTSIDGNVVHLHLSSIVNIQMPVRAVWDCQITLAGFITTVVAGNVTITQEVTRP